MKHLALSSVLLLAACADEPDPNDDVARVSTEQELEQVRGLCLQGADHPFLLSRTYF